MYEYTGYGNTIQPKACIETWESFLTSPSLTLHIQSSSKFYWLPFINISQVYWHFYNFGYCSCFVLASAPLLVFLHISGSIPLPSSAFDQPPLTKPFSIQYPSDLSRMQIWTYYLCWKHFLSSLWLLGSILNPPQVLWDLVSFHLWKPHLIAVIISFHSSLVQLPATLPPSSLLKCIKLFPVHSFVDSAHLLLKLTPATTSPIPPP